MKRKISAILIILLFSLNLFSYAESEVPVDQKKELIKMVYFNAKMFAKEDVDPAQLLADTLMKLAGEDDAEFEKIMSSLLQSVDEYGDYISKEDQVTWNAELSGQSGGIGATVAMVNGRITIENVIEGSPAEKAGIKPGYVLIKANDVLLEGMSLNKALSYVRGEIGTNVALLFEISESETAVYTLTRDKIEVVSVFSEIIGKEKNIGYIKISNFSDETGNEFSKFLKDFKAKGINKLILDLRNNGGGTAQGAVQVSDALLKKGDTIFTIEPKNLEESFTYTAGGQEFMGDIVVLVNEYSASASEVVTGALKDNKRATVIGTRTYGKGTVQSLYPMYLYGGIYKFTTAYYNTPSGVCINKIGIAPNLTVENKKHHIPEEKMPSFAFTRELVQGDSGEDISEIKKGLALINYKVTETDIYDYEMVNAIKDFQTITGITPTGMCDVNTMQRLYNILTEIEISEDTQLETAVKFFEEGL